MNGLKKINQLVKILVNMLNAIELNDQTNLSEVKSDRNYMKSLVRRNY